MSSAQATARYEVSNRIDAAVRLAHATGGVPDARAFGDTSGLRPEQARVYDAAAAWYLALFGGRPARAEDEIDLTGDDPTGVTLSGRPGLLLDTPEGVELRMPTLGDRWPTPPPGVLTVRERFALARRLGRDPLVSVVGNVQVCRADLIDGRATAFTVDADDARAGTRDWLDAELARLRDRTATPVPRIGAECATCAHVASCPAHRAPRGIGPSVAARADFAPLPRSSRGLLPTMLGLTPTSVDRWTTCRREYLDGAVLALPSSDQAPPAGLGNALHAMLRQIHVTGSCFDDAHVADVLAAHGLDEDPAIGTLVERHRRRCPGRTAQGLHEVELARFHRAPPPIFMATARLDAVWIHDGLLDVRDYKTGRPRTERVADDTRARVQAWVCAPVADRKGLRIRVRYEHLSAGSDDDPEPFDPEPEDLDAIEEELRRTAEDIRRAAATSDGFPGVADPILCGACGYRSVCPDSAAPGVPTWPVPPNDVGR